MECAGDDGDGGGMRGGGHSRSLSIAEKLWVRKGDRREADASFLSLSPHAAGTKCLNRYVISTLHIHKRIIESNL